MAALSVLCTAQSERQAAHIVDDLRASYYSRSNISILFPDRNGVRRFPRIPPGIEEVKVWEWLNGIGPLRIPGMGSCVAGGPLMASLAGLTRSGDVKTLAAALIALGIPEHQARRYESQVKVGQALISVHTQDPEEARFAREIFKQEGAGEISSTEDMIPPREIPGERRVAPFNPSRFLFC